MSIDTLLAAAEYLERCERETEHGYASIIPTNYTSIQSTKKQKVKKKHENRTIHNELEKHRRAQLKNRLDKLKELVPLSPQSNRHTTLGLLNKAKNYIESLEASERKKMDIKSQLNREKRFLLRKLNQLKEQYQYNSHRIRSISESSSGFSSISTSPTYEDETGYITSSTASDVEDQNSVQSDCGVTIIMERLDVKNASNLNHSFNNSNSSSSSSQNIDEDSFLYSNAKLVANNNNNNSETNSTNSSQSSFEWS